MGTEDQIMISTAKQGSGFETAGQLGSFCVEFECSPWLDGAYNYASL